MKADSFQGDIFPLAPSAEPALSATDYFGGKEVKPILMSLETGATTSSTVTSNTIRKADPIPTKTISAPIPEPAPPPVSTSTASTQTAPSSLSYPTTSARQSVPVTASPVDSPMQSAEQPPYSHS